MADFDNEPRPNSSEEQAALELYHQLVNLSPDNGDRALLITLRLPNTQFVGDVWLSKEDVEQLIDGSLTIAQHRIAYGPAVDDAADPLPDIDEDEAADLIAEAEAILKSGGQ